MIENEKTNTNTLWNNGCLKSLCSCERKKKAKMCRICPCCPNRGEAALMVSIYSAAGSYWSKSIYRSLITSPYNKITLLQTFNPPFGDSDMSSIQLQNILCFLKREFPYSEISHRYLFLMSSVRLLARRPGSQRWDDHQPSNQPEWYLHCMNE